MKKSYLTLLVIALLALSIRSNASDAFPSGTYFTTIVNKPRPKNEIGKFSAVPESERHLEAGQSAVHYAGPSDMNCVVLPNNDITVENDEFTFRFYVKANFSVKFKLIKNPNQDPSKPYILVSADGNEHTQGFLTQGSYYDFTGYAKLDPKPTIYITPRFGQRITGGRVVDQVCIMEISYIKKPDPTRNPISTQ